MSARNTLAEGGYDSLADGKGSYRDILKDKDQSVALEQENRQVKDKDITRRLLDDYEARLAQEPGNLKLLRSIAELYTQRKEYGRAREAYSRIVASEGQADPACKKPSPMSPSANLTTPSPRWTPPRRITPGSRPGSRPSGTITC